MFILGPNGQLSVEKTALRYLRRHFGQLQATELVGARELDYVLDG